ncbi:hypothetical protein ACHAXS_011330 [Conticribra weissflogii]
MELSKVLDGAKMTANKNHQIIKYVLDTRDLRLGFEPIQGREQPFDDYAGDPGSRRNVSSFVLCVGVGSPRPNKVKHCQALRQNGVMIRRSNGCHVSASTIIDSDDWLLSYQ